MDYIKQLLGNIMTFCKLEKAMVDLLEEHQRRIYALEENRKLKDSAILSLQQEVKQLRMLLREKQTV